MLTMSVSRALQMLETPTHAIGSRKLAVGDLLKTLDHGPQPLKWIDRKRLIARGKESPIQIPKGVFGVP